MGDVRVSDQVAEIAQTAVVRPGDTLIVRVPTGSTRDAVDRMLEGLRQNLPDVAALVVAAEGLAIYRPEAPRFEITAGPDVTPEQAERFARSMQRSESIRRRTA